VSEYSSSTDLIIGNFSASGPLDLSIKSYNVDNNSHKALADECKMKPVLVQQNHEKTQDQLTPLRELLKAH